MVDQGSVLVVCTANVCRSPLAERLLRDRFAAAGIAVRVTSAGVRALEGAPMCVVSAAELPPGDADGHAAHQVDRGAVEAADLVLAMEREQRGALVREAPGSQAKVFTLREASALVAGVAERGQTGLPDAAALARAMHALRGLVVVPADPEPARRWFRRPTEPDDPLTIPDGHGADDATHRAAARRVHDFSDAVADAAVRLLT